MDLGKFRQSLAWTLLAGLLILTFVGIPVAGVIAVVAGLWAVYRIVRGWIALAGGRPMPV